MPLAPVVGLRRIRSLNERAWEIRNRDAAETARLANESLGLARDRNADVEEAFALTARAYAFLRQSRGAEAIADAERAVEIFRGHDDTGGLRRALNTLGIAYGDSSRFMDALEIFLGLLKSYSGSGNARGEADALNNVGIVYVNLDDHTAALEYHLRSLRVAQESGYESGEARSLTNLGSVVYELGRFDEALDYLQQSLGRRSGDGDPHTYGITLINVGRCFQKLGRNDEALEALEKGHALLEGIDHVLGVANALDSIGDVHLAMGKPELALSNLRTSLAIKESAGDRKGLAATLLRIAEAHRELGRDDQAREALQEALSTAIDVGSRSEAYRAHRGLSNLAESHGDLDEALRHFKAYNRVKDELFNEASDNKLRALRVGFEVEQAQKESEIYRLKNVELAKVNEELELLTRSLREADAQKSRLVKQLERQAREDELTGLYNRRHFDRVIAEAFDAAHLTASPLSVAVCDIDNFKTVNDSFGHAVGDEVLRVVARLLTSNIRAEDLVARYGGEEFIVMFPDAEPDEAHAVAERIRRAIQEYDWATINPALVVTISVGLATQPTSDHHERLISIADDNLYAAKTRGKNMVVTDTTTDLASYSTTPVLGAIDARDPANLGAATDRPETEERREPPALPAGLAVHSRDHALETVTTQVGSVALLASRPNLEVSEGTLDRGGRMTLVPASDDGNAESYYLLSGALEGDGPDGTYMIKAGQHLTVDGIRHPITLTAQDDVHFVYTSPKPTFHEISQELDELRRLAVSVEFVDGYTADHCSRLQTIAYAIGHELGLPRPRLHVLDYAAYLHDVGKIRIPSEILRSPAPLSDAEWEVIRKHPGYGAELLEGTFMADAAPIVAQHHERLDGSGYPRGLSGDQILLESHIVAVADTFDAMTSDRPYRLALRRDKALGELRRLRDIHFPGSVVDAFERVLPTLRF